MGFRDWGVAAVGVLALAAPPALASPQAARIARIEADLEPPLQIKGRQPARHTLAEEMAARHTPSVSIAVVDHGRILWAKAYGFADVVSGRKATATTMFQAGSISKPVAASGAMKLVAAQRFALEDAANSRLTSWRIPDDGFTRDHPVTLRELWTHTAGMTVHGFPGYAAGTSVPTAVQVLEGKPPANTPPVVVDRTPGTAWNYSGGGVTIAQLVMTDVTHEPFPALMRRLVLQPVGMTDSSYVQPPTDNRANQVATGYLSDGKAVEGRYHTYPEMAAAGLWTTPTDLAKWAVALARAYNGEASPLMSTASARTMLTPGLGHWGIGIEVQGAGDDLRFDHGGDDWGFKANLVAWPKGERAIVGMANGDGGAEVIAELTEAVAREYGWKGVEPVMIEAVTLTPEQMREVAGSYGHFARVSVDAGALHVSYGGVATEMIALGGDKFLALNGGGAVPIRFNRGADGKIASLVSALGQTFARDP
jgi:CubicO group peptidase (beta-lactamase class C family)